MRPMSTKSTSAGWRGKMAEESGPSTAPLAVPHRWTQIRAERLSGLALVIGAPDTGKSTLAHYLYEMAARTGQRVAFIDGDPGQSMLGPPTTITLALARRGDMSFPPAGEMRRYFIGNVSPRGHMLPLVVGTRRLLDEASRLGAETVIYDTCGLVDRAQGGHSLKLALVELLRPTVVLALQRERELESLLLPLRLSARVRVVDLPASHLVVPRDSATRRAARAAQFAAYFREAAPLTLDWSRLAIFLAPCFSPGRLLALADSEGFTLGLGLVLEWNRGERTVSVKTPWRQPDAVRALYLGDLSLNSETYEDCQLATYARR